jgi:hypothetical protein
MAYDRGRTMTYFLVAGVALLFFDPEGNCISLAREEFHEVAIPSIPTYPDRGMVLERREMQIPSG